MHVVIAGGGVAGLEALLALSELARDLVDVELVSPNDQFVYRPLLVAEPLGAAEVLRIDLEQITRQFSTPGGVPSHVSVPTPGSIHGRGRDRR